MTQPGEPPQNWERHNVYIGEDNLPYHGLCMEDAKILYHFGIFDASALVYFYVVLNQTEEEIPADPDTLKRLGISIEEFLLAMGKIIRFKGGMPPIENLKS